MFLLQIYTEIRNQISFDFVRCTIAVQKSRDIIPSPQEDSSRRTVITVLRKKTEGLGI